MSSYPKYKQLNKILRLLPTSSVTFTKPVFPKVAPALHDVIFFRLQLNLTEFPQFRRRVSRPPWAPSDQNHPKSFFLSKKDSSCSATVIPTCVTSIYRISLVSTKVERPSFFTRFHAPYVCIYANSRPVFHVCHAIFPIADRPRVVAFDSGEYSHRHVMVPSESTGLSAKPYLHYV